MKKIFLSIIAIVLLFACGSSNKEQGSSSTSSAETFDVEKTYNRKCGICHGRDGKLMASGSPDLTISKLSKEEVVAIITNGKNNMPPQRDILSKEEIDAVADYAMKLRK
ncbi:MAG: c-type cytochrome [Flavobacteriales bacterium]|jgi:cytochrome c551